MTRKRTLVAGIGNIFLGDDGFGCEVARRLRGGASTADLQVHDYGIRGLHLAYDIVAGDYDTVVLVDAVSRGEEPGTVWLIEPSLEELRGRERLVEAHAMSPSAVLASLEQLGGFSGRLLVVGCEPADLGEGIGLSPTVSAAVEVAADLVREVVLGRPPAALDG